MSKAQELIENIQRVLAPNEAFTEAVRRKRSPEEVKAILAKHGEVKGGRVVAAGQQAAHDNLVDQIHMSAKPKISREDAQHVAKFYLKKKLAKLDHISQRGSVKHGAYLEPDVIHKALHMAREAK